MTQHDDSDALADDHPKGKVPHPFAYHNDRRRVRRMMNRDKVAHLIAYENLTHREVAEKLGLSRRWVAELWAEARAAAFADTLTPKDLKTAIRLTCETGLRELIAVGMEKYPNSASYGTVALQAIRTLMEMHDAIRPEEEGRDDVLKSIEAVAESVRAVSPLIADKLLRLQRLKARGGT
jgi:predicted DNA-binding protein (UPF0251 family)